MVPFLIFIYVFKNAAFTEISSHAFSLDNIKINFQFELTFSFAMSLCTTIYSCMCFLHCTRYRLHHELLLLMKSLSVFIHYVQFSVIARKLNTPVSLCSQWGPSWYDKRGETFFSPMLWIYLTNTHSHAHTYSTFCLAPISICLPHDTYFFPLRLFLVPYGC